MIGRRSIRSALVNALVVIFGGLMSPLSDQNTHNDARQLEVTMNNA